MNENENYDARFIPLSTDSKLRAIQEKIMNGVELSLTEKIMAGRDHTVKEIDGYQLKPDCVYRAISKELYDQYLDMGYIYGYDENDEYIEYEKDGKIYNNNKGVDWYLGGVSLKYGDVVIECPASHKYFTLAFDNGCRLSIDPSVRHMKSSGFKNPVPISMVKLIKYPNTILNNDHLETDQKHR